jgi:RimJ/RimL family protein N-acetyltransferase
MPGGIYLRGDRLDLRTVEPADYDFLQTHWNDPAIRSWVPPGRPYSQDDIARFVEGHDRSMQLLPCRDEEPVGLVFLFDIEMERDHAELAYWIVSDEQGAGYATEAAELALSVAFEDLGLHKVLARVFEGNDASMRVLEKLGFEREGRLRENDFLRGEHKDTVLFGLLAEEWTDYSRE